MREHETQLWERRLLQESAWVSRVARSLLSDPELARDVGQDALTVALGRPPELQGQRLRAWLGGVTRNLARRARRREGARRDVEGQAASADVDDTSPLRAVERLELQRSLAEALLELDEPYRSTIVMRFFDDLSPKEIAKRKGIDPATARQHLSRALGRLRRRLDREHGGGRARGMLVAAATAERVPSAAPILASLFAVKHAVAAVVILTGLVVWTSYRSGPSTGIRTTSTETALADSFGEASEAEPEASEDRVARNPMGVEDEPWDDRRRPLPPSRLEITIVARDERPVSDAQVILCAASEARGTVRTDRRGIAAFPADDGPVSAVVVPPGEAGAVFQLATGSGQHVLKLPDGNLRGSILVNGKMPRGPLGFVVLLPDVELPEGARDSLPEGNRHLEVEVVTDERGRFLVPRLPRTRLRIRLDEEHWFEELPFRNRPRTLELPSPPEGPVELRATRLPTIRGRVLEGGTGAAVPGAIVAGSVVIDGQGMSPHVSSVTAADGRFRIPYFPGGHDRWKAWVDPLLRTRPLAVELQFGRHDYVLRGATFEFATGADGDVGDLSLSRGRSAELLVLDNDGGPLAGARSEGAGPSDDRGRLQLTGLDMGDVELTVGAAGYRYRRVTIPAGATDPISVTLQRANELVVHLFLVHPDEESDPPSKAGITVRIVGDPPLFEGGKDGLPSFLHFRLTGMASSLAGRLPDGRVWAQAHLDEGSRCRMTNLRPDTDLTVQVLAGRSVITERAVGRLGERGRRSVEIEIDSGPGRLDGRVVNLAGAPVPRASVDLEVDGHHSLGSTKDDGTFVLPFFEWQRGHLTVHGQGFAPRRFVVDAPGETVFVVGPGLPVEVEVIDAAGGSLPATVRFEEADGVVGFLGKVAPGRYRREHAPPGELDLVVEIGGREHRVRRDRRSSVQRIVLPVHGTLDVHVPASRLGSPGEVYNMYAVALDGSETVVESHGRVRTERGLEWDALFLLPGRYRIEIGRGTWSDGVLERTPVFPPFEVEIVAGERTEAVLP